LSTFPSGPVALSSIPRSRIASVALRAFPAAGPRLIDQFDAEQEALAPDVPDQGVAFGECQLALPEVGAVFRGAGDQALIFDDGQDRERGRAGYRVTAEGAEQLDLLGNGLEQLGSDHQGGDRETVAHRLAHHHHVRRDP
jgi:hypothetical protein